MLKKEDLKKYLIVGLVLIILIGFLLILKWKATGFSVLTGYAVYYDGPGEGQTTLMLQNPNSDNSGDAYVGSAGDSNKNFGSLNILKTGNTARTYLKFNISGIPDNQKIDNSTLCLYVLNTKKIQLINVSYVYTDFDELLITWNNQPCGINFDNSTACNLTPESFIQMDTSFQNTWICWNVKNMVKNAYNSGDTISIIISTSDSDINSFNSKEYPDSSLIPYLNITYHTANTAPSISLIDPEEGTAYGYNTSIALDFLASDSDGNLDSCWYNLDNGDNIRISNCQNTTFDASEGIHSLNIYANDSLGLIAEDSVNFSVQVGAPTIILNFPINSYLNSNNVIFSYIPSDVDLEVCELWGDFNGNFSINQTDSSPVSGTLNNFNLSLLEGSYLWNVRCNDSIGNFAFNGNKSFHIDTLAPNISLTEPAGTKTSRSITALWIIEDSSPVSCLYNIYRGGNIEIANSSVNCSLNFVSFDVTVDADFVFNFYVNDSAGNNNYSSISFSVDTSTSSPPISGGGGGGGGGGSIINTTQLGKMSVSQIGEIIAREGDKKTLSLSVENIGRVFLNNCRLVITGNISSWIYSTQKHGIAPGENIDFNFDLNVPEEIQSGDYNGQLEVKCDEGNNLQDTQVSISSLSIIQIKEIMQDKNALNISYELDNSRLIGNSLSVDIWLVDANGIEVNRIQDIFPINKEGPIERKIKFELDNDEGIYNIYFALSDDLDNFVRQSIVLGRSGATGFVIFDTDRGKLVIYIIFLIIIAVAVFFIWRRHGKSEHKKDKWLLRKKK